MTGQTLPLELVYRILHNTYFVEEGVKDSSTLSACSLVSPSWTGEAQRLLHHSIRVASCPSFRPHDIPLRIGSLVRSLEVSVGYSEIPVGDFVTLLAHCPHVYELHLRITEHELDDVTLDLLSNTPTPLRIVALNLQYCGVQSPILFQLLFLWPTIEFLRLGTEIAASPPFKTPTFRLYELTLLRNPPVATLLWLLSNSVGHLRILDFRDPPGHKFELLFDQHGPHLHSLRFFRHAGGAESMIQRCPKQRTRIVADFELPQIGRFAEDVGTF
ncbi:hypothetical protein NLI96_g8136 [Meripilus lineatus]|uniref:F-box domain-containing protein n=1 Tax=Meripilus lineatus TaxID=2056292 RepID=A0AAD5UXT2_9APHY|nr:hypothetical protein NLI96_g8136 [Physisporinus lineatus]